MFTIQKNGGTAAIRNVLVYGLLMLTTFIALISRPEHDHPQGHIHGDASTDGIQSVHPESGAVQAFSFASLLGMYGVTTQNFPVEPVAELAKHVAKQLQSGIQRPIHVVTVNRRELTPLAAVSRNRSMCIVILNTNPDGWAIWDRFFNRVPESERMNVVELALAHEIGHCAERDAMGDNMASGSFDVLEGEVYADIYATLYAQHFMGERSTVALNALRDLREQYGRNEPTHATGDRLKALQPQFESLQHQALSPVTLAQTAIQLRDAHMH
jgi:hypothetical protein